MAVKGKSTGSSKVQKTSFGKKRKGLAKKHINKHAKTKRSNKLYVGQGR